MNRLLLAAALMGLLGTIGCDTTTTSVDDGGTEPPEVAQFRTDAEVVILNAIRGRQGTTVWYITPELQNRGGAGEYYLHIQGVSQDPEGPLTECGLTQKVDVPAHWAGPQDFVIECARAPQWVTVYSRSDGESEFRVTDEFCF